MKKVIFPEILGIISFALSTNAIADPEWMDHASWCLKPAGATRTLAQQPVSAGNCAQMQAAVIAGTILSGDTTALGIASTQTQYNIGVSAADYACMNNPVSNQIAIRLLQICQCHNIGAQSSIENNQPGVLNWLRGWRAGPPKNSPC